MKVQCIKNFSKNKLKAHSQFCFVFFFLYFSLYIELCFRLLACRQASISKGRPVYSLLPAFWNASLLYFRQTVGKRGLLCGKKCQSNRLTRWHRAFFNKVEKIQKKMKKNINWEIFIRKMVLFENFLVHSRYWKKKI